MFSSRQTLMVFFVAAMSSLYLGCGGSDGKDGENGQNGQNGQNGKDGVSTLVISTQEPAGQRCKNGGIKVEIGPDSDGDGILAESEITATQYICNGENGAAGDPGTPGVTPTVTTSTIEAGSDGCTNGGIKLTISDGTTSKEAVICNGENGSGGSSGDVPSIATTALEAGDANCANGGVKLDITSGGSTSTQYVCNGAAGAAGIAPSIVTTALDAGDTNCANGGVKIDISVDGTVTDTRYVCNGAAGAQGSSGSAGSNGHNSLISMTDYTGAGCASGSGVKIEAGLDLNDDGVLAESEVTSTKYVCNGANGSGPVGCAAEAEDYCLNQAVENNNVLLVCDTSTGNCVECLTNTDCSTASGEYCSNKACVPYCGDGIINNGEVCDPAADVSTWSKTSCAEAAGAGYTGTLGCKADCTDFDLTGCAQDPCANAASDNDCTGDGPNNAKTCLDAWGDDVTAPESYIVCVENAQCPGVYEEDIDATMEVCYAETPAAPTTWCNTQWPGSITAADTDVYGRVPTSAKDSVTMKLVYGTDVSTIASWASVAASYDKDEGGNSQFKATMDAATYNALAAGTYYYAMAISGDGTNWFYCAFTNKQDDGSNDNGSAPPASTLTSDLMGSMVIQSTQQSWDYTETFDDLTSSGSGYQRTLSKSISYQKDGSTISIAFSGKASTEMSTAAIDGDGILMTRRQSYGNYITFSGLSGIKSISFDYKLYGSDSGVSLTTTVGSTVKTAEALSGSDTLTYEFNDNEATSFTIAPVLIEQSGNSGRIGIDNVKWTTY